MPESIGDDINMFPLSTFSPVYWDYWAKKSSGFLVFQNPNDYKELYLDILESKTAGSFGSYSYKNYIQSKELFPLIQVMKGFEPEETIKYSEGNENYDFPALIYAAGAAADARFALGFGIGIRIDIRIGRGIQNNEPYYVEQYKWMDFQKAWKESKQKHCLYDCLIFPDKEGGSPIRTLIPWFMMKEIE